MARFIPEQISAAAAKKSPAELRVFNALKNSELPDSFTIYHSLGLIDHQHKVLGTEIDFVVIGPKGIFGLEVKGGGVRRDENGRWFTVDRYGEEHQLKESPANQVRDAIGALKNWLRKRELGKKTGRICFGFGVIFPDITRANGDPIFADPLFEATMVCFGNEVDKNIEDYLSKLGNYFFSEKVLNNRHELLTKSLLEQVHSCLRGKFSIDPSPELRFLNTEAEQMFATKQQFETLKRLVNKKSVVRGGAGTGKTFLAKLLAAEMQAQKKRVLLLCFNARLAAELASYFQDIDADLITTMTIHGFLKSLLPANQTAPLDVDELAKQTCKSLTYDQIEAFEFDSVLFDEGQDYLTSDIKTIFDLVFEAHPETSWTWFLDPELQAKIFNRMEVNCLNELLTAPRVITNTLTLNCRNTRPIRNELNWYLNDELSEDCEITGPPVNRVKIEHPSEISKKLKDSINRLVSKGLKARQITILTTGRLEDSSISNMLTWDGGSAHFSTTHGNSPAFSIYRFKGLESPGVILLDVNGSPEEMTENMLSAVYVGITRASFLCEVFVDSVCSTYITEKIEKSTKHMLEG